jgi:hypothetical protein
MINQGLWQRKFGSNPNIIGQTALVDPVQALRAE